MNFQKRRFQLLEVMIALFLIIVCIVPVLHTFTYMYREQRQSIRDSRRDHLAHLIYAQVVEELYGQKVPWGAIQTSAVRSIANEALDNQLKDKGYKTTYTLTIVHPKRVISTSHEFLLNLKIELVDDERKGVKTEYKYLVYVDKAANRQKP